VHSVHVGSRELTLVNWCGNILGPQTIDAILNKEIETCTFAKAKDSSEVVALLSHNVHFNPVEVVIIY